MEERDLPDIFSFIREDGGLFVCVSEIACDGRCVVRSGCCVVQGVGIEDEGAQAVLVERYGAQDI